MNLESLLLTVLFSLAAVAFIGVLNARGLWRTVVASLLALLCLGAALWHTADFRATGAARGTADALQAAGEFAVPVPPPPVAASGSTGSAPALANLIELLAGARALRDDLAAEDPSRARALSDSEYLAFENRAGQHLSRARMLRERAARLAAAPPSPDPADQPGPAGPSGLEEAAELLNQSLQSLNGAARDLQAFFRASGRDEEQRLSASVRQGVEAADAPLRRAQGLAERAGAPGF